MPFSNIIDNTDRKYLKVLGINEEDLDPNTLRTIYKREALKWHPDKNVDDKDNCTQKFHDLTEAYQHLMKRFTQETIEDSIEEELDEFDIFLYEIFNDNSIENSDELNTKIFNKIKETYCEMFDEINSEQDEFEKFLMDNAVDYDSEEEESNESINKPNEENKLILAPIEIPEHLKSLDIKCTIKFTLKEAIERKEKIITIKSIDHETKEEFANNYKVDSTLSERIWKNHGDRNNICKGNLIINTIIVPNDSNYIVHPHGCIQVNWPVSFFEFIFVRTFNIPLIGEVIRSGLDVHTMPACKH